MNPFTPHQNVRLRIGLCSARQFEDSNFRWGAETCGDAEGADAAVDVKLCVALLKPPSDVGRDQAGGRKARVDELQRHLAAVRVTSEAQVNSQLGVMTEENVGCVRHHQTLDSSQLRTRQPERVEATAEETLEVYAN
jgi:hypothetical protein